MNKLSLLAISALTLSGIGSMQASNFNNAVGLSGVGITPLSTVTFDNAGFATNSNIATSFANAGVTFSSPTYYDGNSSGGFSGCAFNDLSGDCVSNFFVTALGAITAPTSNQFSIFFVTPQVSAAFAVVTDNNGTNNTVFQAFKGGSLVEAKAFTTGSGAGQPTTTPNFFGFYNTTGFDRVVLGTTGANLVILDNIQLTSIPEPGTVGLLALGLSGVVAIARRRRSK
jgi:hypothetical protein